MKATALPLFMIALSEDGNSQTSIGVPSQMIDLCPEEIFLSIIEWFSVAVNLSFHNLKIPGGCRYEMESLQVQASA